MTDPLINPVAGGAFLTTATDAGVTTAAPEGGRPSPITREEVARVLCIEAGHDPDDGNNHGSNVDVFLETADAILALLRLSSPDHIADAGKMVPTYSPEAVARLVEAAEGAFSTAQWLVDKKHRKGGFWMVTRTMRAPEYDALRAALDALKGADHG